MVSEGLKQTLYEQIGRRIGEFRKLRNLTQERLAEKADVVSSYIAHIETGARKPTLDVLARIAQALEVPLWRLVADDRPSAEEKAWEAAHKQLGKDVRGLPHEDVELLRVLVRRFKRTMGIFPRSS
jgi:transcriptional regulator with XRE-family HTH domain